MARKDACKTTPCPSPPSGDAGAGEEPEVLVGVWERRVMGGHWNAPGRTAWAKPRQKRGGFALARQMNSVRTTLTCSSRLLSSRSVK
jgi:hypothetical protein